MTKLNPNALALWIAATGIGYLIGGVNGAVAGLVTGVSLSLVVSVFF